MFARHGTLTGSNTVDTITITEVDAASYVVVSIPADTPAGEAFFTLATGGQTPPNPTIGGDDCYRLTSRRPEWPVEVGHATSVTVRMISTAALPYSIHGE
jgi:hypothetical protein